MQSRLSVALGRFVGAVHICLARVLPFLCEFRLFPPFVLTCWVGIVGDVCLRDADCIFPGLPLQFDLIPSAVGIATAHAERLKSEVLCLHAHVVDCSSDDDIPVKVQCSHLVCVPHSLDGHCSRYPRVVRILPRTYTAETAFWSDQHASVHADDVLPAAGYGHWRAHTMRHAATRYEVGLSIADGPIVSKGRSLGDVVENWLSTFGRTLTLFYLLACCHCAAFACRLRASTPRANRHIRFSRGVFRGAPLWLAFGVVAHLIPVTVGMNVESSGGEAGPVALEAFPITGSTSSLHAQHVGPLRHNASRTTSTCDVQYTAEVFRYQTS